MIEEEDLVETVEYKKIPNSFLSSLHWTDQHVGLAGGLQHPGVRHGLRHDVPPDPVNLNIFAPIQYFCPNDIWG